MGICVTICVNSFSPELHPLIVRHLNKIGISIAMIQLSSYRLSIPPYSYLIETIDPHRCIDSCEINKIKTRPFFPPKYSIIFFFNTKIFTVLCRNLRHMVHLCGNTSLMVGVVRPTAFIHCHTGSHAVQSDRRLTAKFTFTCRRALRF